MHIVTSPEREELDNYLSELEIYRSYGSLEDAIHNARKSSEEGQA